MKRFSGSFVLNNFKQGTGLLSNDNGDGNENGKKAIGLDKQNKHLHVHRAFNLVHVFAVVARLHERESA